MCKVTIVIPFYNVKPDFLIRCLRSAINQTYSNIEIILIDDGSNISYKEIINKYKNVIKYYKIKHSGVSTARNMGITKSTGDYLFFLDSDDYIESTCIEELVNLANNKYDLVISSARFISDDKKINVLACNENIVVTNDKRDLLKSIIDNKHIFKCVEPPWGKLYSKNIIMKYNIKFDKELLESEDGIFNFEFYSRSENIYISKKILYNYVVHKESTCHQYNSEQDKVYPVLIKKYEKLFKKLDINNFDGELNLFSMRLFCRLIRKCYSHENTYKCFKYKVSKIDKSFKNRILKNQYSLLSFGRKIILFLLRKKVYFGLYIISKSKINIK